MTENLILLSNFLAKAVAHRLAAIVPDSISVQADGGDIAVALNNETWEYISMSLTRTLSNELLVQRG